MNTWAGTRRLVVWAMEQVYDVLGRCSPLLIPAFLRSGRHIRGARNEVWRIALTMPDCWNGSAIQVDRNFMR